MIRFRYLAALALVPSALAAQQPALPLKHAPQPTHAAISAGDLMTRLYAFADDSMQGRETGTAGHVKSTAYIARELKRLGLEPAGDSGTYFQAVPMIRRAFDPASTIAVEGQTFHGGSDFIAQQRGSAHALGTLPVIFGGVAFDTTALLTPEQVKGKIVVVVAPTGAPEGRRNFRANGFRQYQEVMGQAAALVTVAPLSAEAVRAATQPRDGDVFMKPQPSDAPLAPTLTVTRDVAAALLGASPDSLAKGAAGKSATVTLSFVDTPAPARNVVAIVRGTNPKLRGEFVALGAHNDHIGFTNGRAVDHDSLHLYNAARFAVVGGTPTGTPYTVEQQAKLRELKVDLDSVRKLHPARLDSIRNGADDDGSGSVTLLELAEAFAKNRAKPQRSLVFVWHVGEEKGLLGSRWYSDHPTVARDSIVAQLNMDMVGRGASGDIPGGSADYVQLVGSRRLSTELGDLVERVNAKEKAPFKFDYQFDANGHPENIYCRSDHYNYARWGIPVVFFTTGLHGDYHQVTDEPQYIDYPHMARVGQLVYDVALAVANLDHKPVVDHEKPDPAGRCRQ